MTSLSSSIRKFHLYASPRIVNIDEVIDGLRMRRPVSLIDLMRRLNSLPSELRLAEPITTDAALGGQAEMVLRSDGTYTSSGYMRATGLPSFAFQVTASVENAGGDFLPTSMQQGRVFGTDTPGDRQRNWREDGHNENIRQHWLSIADSARLSVRKEYNLSGTLGTLRDIAVAFAEFVGLAAASHPGLALVVLLGSNLVEAAGEPWPFPHFPAGMTIAAGVLLVFGPGVVVPAFVAGGVAEALLRHRAMNDEEARFAAKVFGNTLPPPDQIILTNAIGPKNRPITIPGFGGSYLVNRGDAAFENPMTYHNEPYPVPGQLFIHELTHVWQAKRWPAMAYFCRGAVERDYNPGNDPSKLWSAYGIEQEATIVDRWYAADLTFLATEFNKPNPDFAKKKRNDFDHYINGNIRAGLL
jgi:hypothetical protein